MILGGEGNNLDDIINIHRAAYEADKNKYNNATNEDDNRVLSREIPDITLDSHDEMDDDFSL